MGGHSAFARASDSFASAIALAVSHGVQTAKASFFSFSAAANSSGQSLSLPAWRAAAMAWSAAVSSLGTPHPERNPTERRTAAVATSDLVILDFVIVHSIFVSLNSR